MAEDVRRIDEQVGRGLFSWRGIFQVERLAFMAMTTTTMTMPHPTTDHVVGQGMNRRQDMILPIPLIATTATSDRSPSSAEDTL